MEPQEPGESLPHPVPGDYLVHKAVLHLELRALEPLRQGLPDGLPDHPGTGEADKRSRG